MIPSPPVVCIVLPKSHVDADTWQTLVRKSRDLRLHSLSTAPDSFGSSLERELAFDPSVWESRLSSPVATTIVAILPHDSASNISMLCEQEWVGHIVIIQRDTAEDKVDARISPWLVKREGKLGESSDQEGRGDEGSTSCPVMIEFVLNAVFVRGEHRGIGVGKALIESSLDEASIIAQRGGSIRHKVTALVFEDNADAARLYMKSGLQLVKKEQIQSRGSSRTTMTLERFGEHLGATGHPSSSSET